MRRPIAVLLAMPAWLYSGAVLVVCLFLSDYRCGDSCGTRPEWRRSEDSPEWDLLPWIGGLVFALGTVFLACVCVGRRGMAIVALTLGAAATVAFTLWYEPGWPEHVAKDPTPVLLSIAALAAGLGGAVLAGRPKARTG